MSLTLFRELNQRREILRLSADIGDLLANMGREAEAEKVLTTAVMVGQDDSSLTGTDLALTYTSLAWLRIRQGRIEEARELSHKAIDAAREANDKVAEGKALKLAAEVETKTENREAAQRYYEQAIDTLEQVKMPYLLGDVYKAYGEALERWGNFADAVIYLKKAYESKR
jgi:tetratricopeptide (TPR) repeat protein